MMLRSLTGMIFCGLVLAHTTTSARPSYLCEDLSYKDCAKLADSWAFPQEMNDGLRKLKADMKVAAKSNDQRYKEFSKIYSTTSKKYGRLKAESKGASTTKDPKADEKGTSKYSAALQESRGKLDKELKIYNSLLGKHRNGKPDQYNRFVLVEEKRKGP